MPRPFKWRTVCNLPIIRTFGPLEASKTQDPLIMSVEEYECIRLIDLEALTQEECAQRMKVARTTVQRIYNQARNKLAKALVLARDLVIEGGSYQLCDGKELLSQCGHCHRRGHKNL